MSWQKCPVCNGTGRELSVWDHNGTPCTVCGGAKIISTVNGRPPAIVSQKQVDIQLIKLGCEEGEKE